MRFWSLTGNMGILSFVPAPMTDARLTALSPLDGRYSDKCADVRQLFSESALIARRVRVEAAWLTHLSASGRFPAIEKLRTSVASKLEELSGGIEEAGAGRVKTLERETKHDVKAVEYFVREELAAVGADAGAARIRSFRLHLRRHQQSLLRHDAGRRARFDTAAGDRRGR